MRFRLSFVCAVLAWLAAAWLPVGPPGVQAQPLRAERAGVPPARAAFSTDSLDAPHPLDRRALLAVYRADGPGTTALMRATDAAAYPVFYGAAPVAWGAALLRGKDYDDAYRLTLSEGLALGAALGLKKVFGRPRPYRTLAAVRSRSENYRRGHEGRFAASFPSGHAAVATALATSWSLSHPVWYVVAPAAAGATAIGVSRLWLGVHYPSDVLAGGVLGAGAALVVHLLRDALTPRFLEDAEEASPPPMLRLRFRMP